VVVSMESQNSVASEAIASTLSRRTLFHARTAPKIEQATLVFLSEHQNRHNEMAVVRMYSQNSVTSESIAVTFSMRTLFHLHAA
jgi:hypothetical protein